MTPEPRRRHGGTPGRDPGLAPERTHLAWIRTTVSLLALGAAVTKAVPPVGLIILLLGVSCWLLSRHHRPPLRSGAHHQHRRLRALATALTLASLITLVSTLLTSRSPALPLLPAHRPQAPSMPSPSSTVPPR
ncbi:DUF202 domain-containing protein [Nonomuraea sp. NPDC049421]|uniref:DUF202 domain-containing protein n=1 Tax=Nonomuraea sp. NPDC049421 TaxID=3155275 RepID=UPI0034493E29